MDQTDSITITRLQTAADAQQAYCCMDADATPWPKAVCQCRDWVALNLGKYVEGYHLKLAAGQIVGHLYYADTERALIPYQIEPGVGVLYCDWVLKQHQGQGLGTQLFDIFVANMQAENFKGLVVEASEIEGQMYFGHYQSRGFETILQSGPRKLMYKPLSQPQIEARPLPNRIQPAKNIPVEIIIINGYACPFEAATQMLIREIAPEFGDQVILKEIWLTPETLQEYGVAKGVFINGQPTLAGGETESSIRYAIIAALER
jgi:GNAT superfamily N-acetyltransferase